MSESALHQKALELIANVSGREPASLQPQANLMVDLELDSPKALELLMELEDGFDFEISDEESSKLKTVQDILELVERHAR